MGKTFGSIFGAGGLTNPGVTDPSSGATQYFPSRGQAAQQMMKLSAQSVQPAVSSLPNSISEPRPQDFMQQDTGGPLSATPPAASPQPQFNQPTPAAPPRMGQPTFAQAAGVGAQPGGMNAMSPALSKGGKLLTLLMGGLQGALAGRAASEQALAESGGRRNGGFGTGAEAAMNLPFLRAYQQQSVQRGGLENQMLQSQVANAPLLQRLGILKEQGDIQKTQSDIQKDRYVTPRSGGVYDTSAGQFAAGTEPQDKSANLENLIAAAAGRAQAAGRDPRQDPEVQQLSDLKTSLQKEPQVKTPNDFDQYYSSWMKDNKQPDTAANRLAAHKQWEIKPQQPGAGDARMDRSYQFNSTQLEKLGKPIDDAVTRVGRLQDSLNQNTPQADALVAPELLSVMAGGAGSGLRMNEAEISRIVGGRSNWESLKAAANKWSLDSSTANSITPAQRQQIRALVQTVQQKLTAKQSALDEASQGMINAGDPTEHRKIVAGARSKLTAVDQGTGGQVGGVQVTDPRGVVHTFADQASANNFKRLAGIQ